ncbi:urate oxidase [Rhizoctonia solani]|uniref:factor independent urate hydroxylase n=1 Tax=Rhizoctonia solani TaxID=456999 RepID=A0A0K6GBV4_9AGAM|nr:urate oxidase [Rhizoctonia solani]
MAGDHACPVCLATFTRPQHVARHMRSHTGDRPYKCSVCNDSFGRSDLLKRHEKKMHSATSTTSTPTTTKSNKFDVHISKATKRPQPFPYVDSGTTSVASGSGGDISASASGSGSGSGADSVPTVARHPHGHRPRSNSGSNSDSRSRSRSLSPLRRQEALQDQDELISSDDGGPSTVTKYRRLSDPSGLSRMETDSRKSPSPSAASPRTYGRSAPYNRHNSRETPVLTSSMHGTESVRVCRVIRNEDHHFIVEYAISAMLEGTRPSSTSRVAPVPIKDTCYVLAKTSPHVLSPELFGLHLGAHLVGTHMHVRAARIVIQQVKWGRIPVRGRLHASTFLRDGEEKRSVTIDVRREPSVGLNDDKSAQDVVMAEVRSSIQGLVVMKTVIVRNGYSRDECTNVNEHDDGVYCAQMDVEYLLGLPRVPLRIEELAALGETMRFTDVAQRVRDTSLEVFATDEDEDVQATMHRMSREVLDGNPTIVEVTYRMPNRHYIPVPLDYIGLQNTKAREAEVFCPVDAPSGCISTTVARAG